MKFLLECVGRCMMSGASSGEYSTSDPSSPAASETRSLVASAAASETRLARRRKRTPSRSGTADWRPSLYAISEDNAVPIGPENRDRAAQVAVKPASGRNVRRTCGNSSRVNAHPRTHDFGHNPMPIVVPTFSAAPFMF